MADFKLSHWDKAETAEAVCLRSAKGDLMAAANALSWHPILRQQVAALIDSIDKEMPTYVG
jgi:hypothetical protein